MVYAAKLVKLVMWFNTIYRLRIKEEFEMGKFEN